MMNLDMRNGSGVQLLIERPCFSWPLANWLYDSCRRAKVKLGTAKAARGLCVHFRHIRP